MKCGPAANKFGEFLVKNFYDESVDYFDKLAAGYWKAPASQSLQEALKRFSPEQLHVIRKAVIETLGSGLHKFLFALGEEWGITVLADGVNIVDESDGLHGETFGPDGWMAKYSKYPDGFSE